MTPRLRPLVAAIGLITLTACSEQSADTSATSTAAVDIPADGTWQHPRTPWGDPDLQGMWPVVHLISVPLERPEQYGERLYFTEQELAEQRDRVEARNTRYAQEDSSDRIGMGHWAEMTDLPPQTSLIVDPPNGRLPEMTELGKQMSSTMGSSWGREVFDTVADFDVWDRCITRGMPPSMFPFQYNNGIQILQTPGYLVINLEMIHETRIVPLGAMPPPDGAIMQWLGSSRGHWDGNTLVIETTNFNGLASMTNFGTPGTPITPRATSTEFNIVETLERIDDDTINYSITMNDPVTLTQSWTAAFPWQRDDSYQFFEYACNEDNYAIRNFIETSRFRRAQEATNN